MSFIQVLAQLSRLFNKHLLSAYFVPGKGAGVIAVERKDKISWNKLNFSAVGIKWNFYVDGPNWNLEEKKKNVWQQPGRDSVTYIFIEISVSLNYK